MKAAQARMEKDEMREYSKKKDECTVVLGKLLKMRQKVVRVI